MIEQAETPSVTAEIDAVRTAWRGRLVMACLTMAAILVFFALDMRGRPEGWTAILPALPWFAGLALLFALVTRWTVARRIAQIRARGGSGSRPV
jgi:hypothetical protein